MSEINLHDYYHQQAFGSASPYYVRSYGFQTGRGGIGSFLSSIFRWIQPILRSNAKTVGRQALDSGMDILKDMGSGVKPMESIRSRAKEASKKLQTRLMTGQGIGPIKMRRAYIPCQSSSNLKRKRKSSSSRKKKVSASKKRRKAAVHRDIFV